jgi:hypothetical protein
VNDDTEMMQTIKTGSFKIHALLAQVKYGKSRNGGNNLPDWTQTNQ